MKVSLCGDVTYSSLCVLDRSLTDTGENWKKLKVSIVYLLVIMHSGNILLYDMCCSTSMTIGSCIFALLVKGEIFLGAHAHYCSILLKSYPCY